MHGTKTVAAALVVMATLIGSPLENGCWTSFAATAQGDDIDVTQRTAMRVSLLCAGMDAADVERLVGRPTTKIDLGGRGNLELVYSDQPITMRVTLAGGRVTSIALDLIYIDTSSLRQRARMLKPMMTRGGVLAPLGKPDADERRKVSGMEVEQLVFNAGESAFSVFLVDDVVVDAKPGAGSLSEMEHLILPAGIPDASVGDGLRIGLSFEQAVSRLGSAVWAPTRSTLKGEPVLYTTYHKRDSTDVVSLTFIGGTLTAFTEWRGNTIPDLGDSCCFEPH
jgi:hypothetical protein